MLAVALLGGSATAVPSRASADDLMIIRCVGYETPIVVSGKMVGYAKNDQSFDIFLSPSRGIGWWSGLFNIDEDHPAKLTIDPATYQLEAEEIFEGHKWIELIVIDRISSSMAQFSRLEGTPSVVPPSGELKRGGNCANLKPKF